MSYTSEVLADAPWGFWPMTETPAAWLPASTGSDTTPFALKDWPRIGQDPLPSGSTGRSAAGSGYGLCYRDSCPASLQGSNVTASLWFDKPADNIKGSLVHLGSGSNGWGFGIGGTTLDNTGSNLILLTEGVAWHNTGVTIPTGLHHLMVVRGVGDAVTAYLDGVSVWSGSLSAPVTPTQIHVGGYRAGVARDLPYGVRVDEVALFASALSGARAVAHYNAGAGAPAAVAADSPVVLLTFDDLAGSAFVDVGMDGRDLVALAQAPSVVAGPAAGAGGQKWLATPGYAASGAGIAQPATVTYELWVRYDTLPAAETPLLLFGGSEIYGPTSSVTLLSDGRVRFGLYSGANATITAPSALAVGVWHHVVCKVGTGGAKIRVNKADVASSATAWASSLTSGALYVRGGGANGPAGTGAVSVAAPAVWTSLVSDVRTDAHYDAMFVGGAGLGVVSEVDAAHGLAVSADSGVVLGVASEVSTARVLGAADGSVTVTLGVVSESSAALALGAAGVSGTVRDVTSARNRTGVGYVSWMPAVDPTPAHLQAGYAVDKALAFGPVSIVGTQPVFDVYEAETVRHRDRIIVGGRDVTYFRGAEVVLSQYQLIQPFGYGTATLEFPQVYPEYEQIGVGDLKWLKPGNKVIIQRVDVDGTVVATDFKGILTAPNASTGTFSFEVGGQVTGPASLRFRPLPLFRSTQDVGWQIWRALSILGVRTTPRLGVETGIELARVGGMPFLDYLQQLVGRAWTRNGRQWTVMPNEDGVYETKRKNLTTIAGTVYLSQSSAEADLRRDITEEPNRVFATGVTPEGKRVRFGRYPGLQDAADVPFPGFLTEGDTGDNVLALIHRLRIHGYLNAETVPGGYDADVTEAVASVQEDSDLPVTGNVNETTWEAIFDTTAMGVTTKLSRIEPAAQKSYTRKYRTSASGAIIGRNPNYDPTRLPIDREVDFGAGFKRSQMREWSKAEIADGAEPNWVGTLTIHSGAIVAGEHVPGTPIAEVMPARDIRPGMNLWLPQFQGGTLVHVTAATVSGAVVTLQVDTRARDAWNVAQVIERDRESRKDPARAFFRRLSSSTIQPDALSEFSEVGGIITKQELRGGEWNVIEVVAGDAGTIRSLRLDTNPNAESSVAIFGKRVWPNVLQREIGDPLTQDGADRWRNENVLNRLRDDHGLLYSAGDADSPGGYSPGNKFDGDTLTGRLEDEAGVQYYTDNRPFLYVAVWVDRDCTIPAGRIMWPQLEPGV